MFGLSNMEYPCRPIKPNCAYCSGPIYCMKPASNFVIIALQLKTDQNLESYDLTNALQEYESEE